MGVLTRRPVLRWLVPAGVLIAIVAGGLIAAAVRANENRPLPSRSPVQLLANVRTSPMPEFSGTLTERADLGMPPPDNDSGDGDSQFTALAAGTHTLRVWYAGPELMRIALLGALGESDIIRRGSDLWTWTSTTNYASHAVLPPRAEGTTPGAGPSPLPTTPQQAASALLSAIDPSTSVTVGAPVVVAGRSAYTLVISPRAPGSLIRQARIAVDGENFLPLRVQAFARGSSKAAFEIGFTQITFQRPDPAMFVFNPPSNLKVHQLDAQQAPYVIAPGTTPTLIGSGWTAVLAVRLPLEGGGQLPSSLNSLITSLPYVKGAFGDGRLLRGTLFTMLVTADGRLLIGAVDDTHLLAAADSPAAKLTAPK